MAKAQNIDRLEIFGRLYSKNFEYAAKIYTADIHSREEEETLKDKWQLVKEL